MAITPNPFSVSTTATIELASAINNAVWFLTSGTGSFSAGSTSYKKTFNPAAAGSVSVKAQTALYGSTPSWATKSADEVLTVTTSTVGSISLIPTFSSVGDFFEFAAFPNFYCGFLTGGNRRCWFQAIGFFTEGMGFSSNVSVSVGDIVRFEMASAGQVIVKVNGTTVYTFTDTFSGSTVAFIGVYNSAVGTVIQRPNVGGSGISGLSEETATGTVFAPLTITTASLPNAIVGAAYSQTIAASGGAGSLAWSVGGGSMLPSGFSLSTGGVLSGTPSVAGSYSFAIQVADSGGQTATRTFSLTIDSAPPLPYGFAQEGTELFCEANLLSQSNGSNTASFTDQTIHARHLTTSSGYPTFQTNVINGKAVIRISSSQNPLSNPANFPVSCGWILAKFNGSSFSDYKGLLTDLTSQVILTSNSSGTTWFSQVYDVFEYRSNDRIYPQTNAPAPMNAFKLIFFRFGKAITANGIQIFQDRTFTARKWNGDVALVVLCSRGFCESDIRARSQAIAAAYGLPLADVYPYQADKTGSPQRSAQSVNFYDPPEGDRISEVLSSPKRQYDLKFGNPRQQSEVDEMTAFHAAHYAPAVPCIYRDYDFYPPRDVEGYINSPYELDGAVNNFAYSFSFKEK